MKPAVARRQIVIRLLRPDDCGRLEAFYSGLSPRSRRNRFFAERVPPQAAKDACEATAGEASAPSLVAIDPVDPDVVVAEATTAWRGPACAELALAVSDDRQGHGLGSAMLSAVANRAALAGIRTLLADVLGDNNAMLTLLRSRHAVAVSPQQLPVLTLAIAADGTAPHWPPGPSTRVLIEGGSWLTLSGQEGQALVDQGCSVVACPAEGPGRGPRPDCPGLHGRICALRSGADRVLYRFPGERLPTVGSKTGTL